MDKIIAITNRKLCSENFYSRIERLANCGVNAIILREKDLNSYEYITLADKAIDICRGYCTEIIIHNFIDVAKELNHRKIHLPISKLNAQDKFDLLGVSCHSLEELKIAEKHNADYITFGHVFNTNCKKDLSPRGLDSLEKICESSSLPIYALGGITPHNCKSVMKAGSKGIAIMSSAMEVENPAVLIKEFRKIKI